MLSFPFLLQIAALVCMCFAAFNWFQTPKVVWGWLGLLFWFMSFMVQAFGLHPAAVH